MFTMLTITQWRLLRGPSHNTARGQMSTVHCPGSHCSPPSHMSVIESRPSGTQPHCCSPINTTVNVIYPSRRGTLPLHSAHSPCTILPPDAESLENKQGANKSKASRRALSLLYAQDLTEKPNTDYPGHMISSCVRLSFMSSSYFYGFPPSHFSECQLINQQTKEFLL